MGLELKNNPERMEDRGWSYDGIQCSNAIGPIRVVVDGHEIIRLDGENESIYLTVSETKSLIEMLSEGVMLAASDIWTD